MRYEPHDYQRFALEWLIQRTVIEGQPGGALFMDPGLGKTSVTLAWIKALKKLRLARKALIIAPLRVVYAVWPEERDLWDQFNGLRISIVHGDPQQREKALAANADLYLINPEGVPWLQRWYAKHPHPFDTLVVDESSKFKGWSTKRTKALKKMLGGFTYRVILTGTPCPNNLVDLFSQIYILDEGKSIGTGVTQFRDRYCYRGGYGGYKWIPYETSEASVEKRIRHQCLRLEAKDHLDLPELLINDVKVTLPKDTHTLYRRWERELFLALDSGEELTASNAGAKYMTCRQLANGGFYKTDDEGRRESIHVHQAKIEATIDLVDELQGKPVLISYPFKSDLERLRKVWPELPAIHGGISARISKDLIAKWNRGDLHLLAVQPQAMSHGVNMQVGPGRDIIWLGLVDDLETYLQLNARIWRQNVTGQVRVHRLMARGTVDTAIAARLRDKSHHQDALLRALKDYRKDVL